MTEEEKTKMEFLEREIQELKAARFISDVNAKAAAMGIPENRINEGFALSGNESAEEVDSHLKRVASHYKRPQILSEDIKKIAAELTKR